MAYISKRRGHITKKEVLSITNDDTFKPASRKLQFTLRLLKPISENQPPSNIRGSPMEIDQPQSIPQKAPINNQNPPFTPSQSLPLPPSNPPQHLSQNKFHSSGQITTFSKLYTNEMRYSGEEAKFDFKLSIFYYTYQRSCLPENQTLTAFL
ncbi:hypothetical protein Golomagni_01166 [Golovinomyces magnicellulatus]|nr:hypothetical protein Golomagni_01166 [Golovinomyces magnicellulatus]